MAKKSLETDDLGLDSDLDFDFGGEIDTGLDQSSSKSRSPVMSVAVGAVTGVGDVVTSPSFYKDFLNRAMPKHYGEVASGVGEAVSEISELYDQTRNEVKPRLNKIATQLDRMTPESSKTLKGMVGKLVDWTSDGRSSSSPSSIDQEDAAVTAMLGSIFQAQVQKDKIEETRQIMRDAIENKRATRNFGVSSQMAQDISTIQQYTTSVTQGYQRKSLELQLRSYLAQRAYFSKSLQLLEANQEQNKAIIKNTGLSEASKITELERIKSNAKERMINALYGEGSVIKRAAKGLKDTVGGYVEGFGRRLDMADMQLDMANFSVEMIRDLNQSLVDMGQEPITKEQLAGAVLGNVVVDEATQRAMPYIQKFFDSKKGLKDKLAQGARIALNPSAKIKELANSKTITEGMEAGGIKGQAYKFANLLLNSMTESEPNQDFRVGLTEKEGLEGQGFNKKAYVSLVTVIPGYLARIHQELMWSRVKTKTAPSLLKYNFVSDKFESAAIMQARSFQNFDESLSRNTLKARAESAVASLAGEEELDADQKLSLTAFISRLSRQRNFKYEDIEAIKELPEFKDLTPENQSLFIRLFDNMERDEDAESRKTEFVRSVVETGRAIPSQYESVEDLIKEGYGDDLARRGLVSKSSSGDTFSVDNDKVFELTLEKLGLKAPEAPVSQSGTFTSDMNAKEDIKSTTPSQLLKTLGKRAYEGMKNTKIFDWKYKKGIGEDQEPHSGPMAQGVRENLGDAAAPGGTSIDPQTITGSFFAAIQHLGNKVEDLFKRKGVSIEEEDSELPARAKNPQHNYLKSIDTRLAKIHAMLADRFKTPSVSGGVGAGGRSFSEVAAEHLDSGLEKAGKAADWVGQKVGDAADSLSTIWLNNKDKLKEAAVGMFNSASSLATSLFDQTKKFTTEILPDWVGKASDFGKRVWKGITDELTVWRDVYLPGGTEPVLRAVLLKAGEYRDAVTNKVIESMAELSEAKGDIIDSAGNVVVSARELAAGIYDNQGEKIKATSQMLAGKVVAAAKWVGGKLMDGAAKLKDLITGGLDKGKEWWNSSPEFKFPEFGGGAGKRQLAELINIRDILLGKHKEVRRRIKDVAAKDAVGAVDKVKGAISAAKEAVSGQSATESFVGPPKPGLVQDLAAKYKGSGFVGNLLKKFSVPGGAMTAASAVATQLNPEAYQGPLTREQTEAALEAERIEAEKQAASVGPQQPKAKDKLLGKLRNLLSPEKKEDGESRPSLKDRVKEEIQKLRDARRARKETELDEEPMVGPAPELVGPATPSKLEQAKAQLKTKFRATKEESANKVKLATEAAKKKGLKATIGEKLGAAKGFAKGKLGAIASTATGLLGGSSESSESPGAGTDGGDGLSDQQKEAAAHAASEPKVVRSKRGAVASKDRDAGDQDGDGVKDGSVEEARNKVEALKASRDKGMLEADSSAKYKSSENVIDTMAKKLGGMLEGISSGLGSIFNVAGLLLGGGGKIAGGIMKSFGLLGRGAAALGSITGGAGAGMGTVARLGWGAAKIYGAASAASTLIAGSTLAGMGSLAMGAVSAVGGALLSAVASSVVAVPLAVAGGAWLLYQAYKYAVRDNASEIESLRLQQYGLNYNTAVARYNHHAYVLEAYLQDGRVGYSSKGEAYLLTKKIDTKELLSAFEIDEKDDLAVRNFTAWFENRFKPFFLAHVGALLQVDKQKKLSDVNSLDESQKLRYLEIVKFPNGPYEYDVSPFGEKVYITTNGEEIVRQYDNLILKTKAELDKKATETKKILKPEQRAGNPAQLDGGDQDKKDAQQKINDAKKALQANESNNTNPLQASDGDGKAPTSDTGGTSKEPAVGKVNMAPGTMKDGAEGMQFVKLNKNVKLDGLSPSMLKQFMGMAEEYGKTTGKTIPVTSGTRTSAEQAALYAANPQKAAPPGRSLHEFGLALDIDSAAADELDKLGLMKKYGFTRPVGGERWHVEPAGIQPSIDLAKANAERREQMVQASVGRGGGGVGSEPGSPLGKRNHALAMKLLNVPVQATVASNKSEDAVAALGTGQVAANDDTVKPVSVKESISTGNAQPSSASKSRELPPAVEKASSMASPSSSVESEAKPVGTGEANLKKGGEVVSIIDEAAKRAGVDADKLKAFAAVESGMNPGARNPNSSASGLMQFMPKTFEGLVQQHGRKYGLDSSASPMDPMASSLMGAEYMKANMKTLSQVKPNPNLTDVYFAHLLGPSGAKNFFSTEPSASAPEALPRAAAQNKDLFYEDGKPLTIDGVYKKVHGRIQSKVKAFGLNADIGGPGLKAPTPSNSGAPGLKQSGSGVNVALPSANSDAIAPKETPKESAPRTVNASPARGFSFDSTSAGYIPQTNQAGQRVDGNPNVKLESLLEKSNDTASASLKALEKIAASLSEESLAKVLKTALAAMPKAEATKEETVKEKDRQAMGRTSTAAGSSLDLNRRTAA